MNSTAELSADCFHVQQEIKGTDDFELGAKRNSSLSYTMTLPSGAKPKGLVLVIPGFGADSNSDYQQKLRTHIATQYGWAAASVNYHAISIRPQTGANIVIEQDDILSLQQSLLRHQIAVRLDLEANLFALSKVLVAKNIAEELSCSLVPPNGDYQNFGIMQAIDHLLALADILRTSFNGQQVPIIAFGSSHGGYLANLLAKLAPNTFSAVLDNSAYVSAPYNYVLGRQTGMSEFSHQMPQFPRIIFRCFSRNPWSLQRHLPNFFSHDRQEIRAFYNGEHLAAMARSGNGKTQYRFIHSVQDGIALFGEKKRYVNMLRQLGFDVQLREITGADVDGSFVKNLEHGMGLSLKKMFDLFFPSITPKSTPNDFQLDSTIVYEGFMQDYVFAFQHGTVAPAIRNLS